VTVGGLISNAALAAWCGSTLKSATNGRTDDSDMLQYAPVCDAVHQVSNLAELGEAVDKLFVAR
jgi:hypothetical protein